MEAEAIKAWAVQKDSWKPSSTASSAAVCSTGTKKSGKRKVESVSDPVKQDAPKQPKQPKALETEEMPRNAFASRIFNLLHIPSVRTSLLFFCHAMGIEKEAQNMALARTITATLFNRDSKTKYADISSMNKYISGHLADSSEESRGDCGGMLDPAYEQNDDGQNDGGGDGAPKTASKSGAADAADAADDGEEPEEKKTEEEDEKDDEGEGKKDPG